MNNEHLTINNCGKLIILASASPRRQAILKSLNIEFETLVTDADETVEVFSSPQEFVTIVAKRKGHAAMIKVRKTTPDALIISADTIVVINGKILGKPRGKKDACEMLSHLSGRTHQVYTGVNIIGLSGEEYKEYNYTECSDVTFRPLTQKEIQEYVDSGEPMDKAGAYGIQGLGGKFVTHYTGELNNIIGLPTKRLAKFLDR